MSGSPKLLGVCGSLSNKQGLKEKEEVETFLFYFYFIISQRYNMSVTHSLNEGTYVTQGPLI
jgi:hypothetical protein